MYICNKSYLILSALIGVCGGVGGQGRAGQGCLGLFLFFLCVFFVVGGAVIMNSLFKLIGSKQKCIKLNNKSPRDFFHSPQST